MKTTLRTKNRIIAALKTDFFWVAVLIGIGIAYTDHYFITSTQPFNLYLRTMLTLLMLMVVALSVEENFIFFSTILLFPNTAYAFYLTINADMIGLLVWMLLTTFIIIIIMSLYNWRLLKSFMPEVSFMKMKEELKDLRENSMHRILYFSLVGCMKERDKVLSQAYHVLDNCFKADKSVIFLADYEKNQLIPHFITGLRDKGIPNILVKPDFWTTQAYDPEKGVMKIIGGQYTLPSLRQLIPDAQIETLAAMPLSANNKVIGFMTVIRQKPENRRYLDPALFATFGYVLASALENCSLHETRIEMLDTAQAESKHIQSAFGKYVSKSVVDELIKNKTPVTLGGKMKKVSVMFADLRGFTELSTQIPLETLVKLLNSWFEVASDLILKSDGTIDKYMGDGIMVIFGAPIEKPDDVLRSVYTAFRLQERFEKYMEKIKFPSHYSLGLGVSIASGEAIVGNFGSSIRMEYTAIGEIVNLAARLEKLANTGEIVVDEATFNQLPRERFKFTSEKNIPIKGLGANTCIYRLHEVVRIKRPTP